MPVKEEDSDSRDVEDFSSEDDSDLGAYFKKTPKKLGDFPAFEEDDDNTEAAKMRTILALRETLGMDRDQLWLIHERRKDKGKKKHAKESFEEKVAEAGNMFAELQKQHGSLMDQKKMEKEREIKLLIEKQGREEAAAKLKRVEEALVQQVKEEGEDAVSKQLETDMKLEKEVEGDASKKKTLQKKKKVAKRTKKEKVDKKTADGDEPKTKKKVTKKNKTRTDESPKKKKAVKKKKVRS